MADENGPKASMATPSNEPTIASPSPSSEPPISKSLDLNELKAEIDRLNKELAAAQQERSQSAAYGLELLNDKEKLQQKCESIEVLYEQSKRDLQELREAWNKAVEEQRTSATTVFEKEVQLLNDSDALAASFSHAKQEIDKELKLKKSQLDSAITEKDRLLNERDELAKKVTELEQERKNLKTELKDLKSRETKLFNENCELGEENVSLQKQVSNLRSTQVEFESSKHEIQRLQDDVVALNSQLEEMVTLKRISERQLQEAIEALQSEREQKYALRKELDKRNNSDPVVNWTSLAALKGSPLANLALRNLGSSSHRPGNRGDAGDEPSTADGSNSSANGGDPSNDAEGTANTFSDLYQASYDVMHDYEMPSIEGSLFDEVHLTEIKKLQADLEEKENQRSNLNSKLIDVQHKLDSRSRQLDDFEKKLAQICTLIEEIYNESDIQKMGTPVKKAAPAAAAAQLSDVTSSGGDSKEAHAKTSIVDDFDNIYVHLQTIFTEFKSYQEIKASLAITKLSDIKKESQSPSNDLASIDQAILADEAAAAAAAAANVPAAKLTSETAAIAQSDDVQQLRAMLFKKSEQLKQLRTVLRSNKESAEVALANLKSKYEIEKAIVAETHIKLRHEHKRLKEDAATFASLRSHFADRIEEYNNEIDKLQSKLAASEDEKNTLNSILRMAVEQKVMLTQKLEALEMDREDSHHHNYNQMNKSANGQQPRSGVLRPGGPNRGPPGGRQRPPRGRLQLPSQAERR